MARAARIGALAAAALAAGCCAGAPPLEVDLAIVGVSVVDLHAGTVTGPRTVLIDDGAIAVVAEPGRAPDFVAEQMIDGAGSFALPGLWDMHVHDSAVPEVLALHLRAGVTGVRDLGGAGEETLAARDRVAAGEWNGPRIVACGPQLDGRPDELGDGSRIRVTTPAEATAAVERLAADGVDLIKVHDVMAVEVHAAVVSAAGALGLPVDGHRPRGVPIEQVAAGQRTLEHVTPLGESALSRAALTSDETFEADLEAYLAEDGAGGRLIAALLANDTAFCPTLVAERGLARASAADTDAWDDPRLADAPEGTAEDWQRWLPVELLPPDFHSQRLAIGRAAERIVAAMHDAGVTILAGTDAGAPHVYWGWALHEELAQLERCGLTPLEALRCATVHPARVLGLDDHVGRVEEGFAADLLIVDEDPLASLAALDHLRFVVTRGVVVTGRD